MPESRGIILSRIRQGLLKQYLPDTGVVKPSLASEPFELSPLPLIDRFTAELVAVGGEVSIAKSDESAKQIITNLVREYGGGPVLSWTDDELPVTGVSDKLAGVGAHIEQVRLPTEPAERHARTQDLDVATVGITGAMAALADTGSLVLLSGPNRPLAASLLPLVHIALLPRHAILPDMAAFLAKHDAAALAKANRSLVFITGPSRTADIEMILTRGVHGPKRLIVIILDY